MIKQKIFLAGLIFAIFIGAYLFFNYIDSKNVVVVETPQISKSVEKKVEVPPPAIAARKKVYVVEAKC